VEREEVQLHRSVFDELVVRIGNWKRNVSLPLGLARLDVASARFEDDRLNVYFAIEAGQEPTPEEMKPTRWQTLRTRFARQRA
jgi:arsenite-transporting ATPase